MARKLSKSGRAINRNTSAFVYGVAHALDLGGRLGRERGRFAYGPAGDAAALRGDWERAVQEATPPPDEPKKDGK